MTRLSVVIPVLDDAPSLTRLLDRLDDLLEGARRRHVEIIVADGGSRDTGAALAAARGCVVVHAPQGRGAQLAAGIDAARGAWIWMLHADSEPSAAAVGCLLAYGDPEAAAPPAWGRFDVAFDHGRGLGVVAFMMNRRSCLTGICTGDQGIFVHRDLLAAAGGMPRQPLMEDIELSRRLRRRARPLCRREVMGASGRRWRRDGLIRTVLGMWRWRLRYWLGADPERLAAEYYR